jgi:hypothetical protein
MSEVGHQRISARWCGTSVLPPGADLVGLNAKSNYLVQQNERSFDLFLVHRFIPKAIEFFLEYPADVPPA